MSPFTCQDKGEGSARGIGDDLRLSPSLSFQGRAGGAHHPAAGGAGIRITDHGFEGAINGVAGAGSNKGATETG